MTKLRALHSALAYGAVSLAIGAPALAGVSEFTIEGGSQSDVDNSCSGPIRGFTFEDCTYNFSDPDGVGVWIGPAWTASYYKPGESPYQTANPPDVPAPGDPNSASLAITGSLTLNDQDNGTCDGDDTISGRFELEAGTRGFSVGPAGTGEESWGQGTVIFVLPDSLPDSQMASGGGCEYIFGDQGAPPLLTTLGGMTYPANTTIQSDAASTNPPATDAWDTATRQAVGIGTFEGAPDTFDGNTGVTVSLDEDAFLNGQYQCVDEFSNPDLLINSPTECVVTDPPVADGTNCVVSATSATFCASRRQLENWIMRIVVGPSGDITEATAFANNETRILNANPPSGPNSWDGSLITFTATCDNCTVAKNDTYVFVAGTTNPIALDVGANDDPEGLLGATTLTILQDADPAKGTTAITNNGGNVNNIGIDYTAVDIDSAFTDELRYRIDDGVLGDEFGLEATVSLTVEANLVPTATAFTIDLDSQGVDPATLSNTTDVATVPGNEGGNDPSVTDDGTAQRGTVTVDGAEITYDANDDFFQGTDTFMYTITDDNFGTRPEETSTAQVTVDIPNVVPTTSDVEATAEAGETVDFVGNITLGNGTIDQHEADGACDNGAVTISGISVSGADVQVTGTYTAPADFEGEDNCTYTVTDEDGAGESIDGAVVITVTESGIVVKLPGAGSALGLGGLALLLLIPLVRSRRVRREDWS